MVFVRIDITNASTLNPLTVTSFTDSLPAGLVVAAGASSIDCATGGGTNGTFSPALAPGATSFTVVNAIVGITGGTRRCRITVPVVASGAGAYLNSIPVNAVVNPGSLGSPTVAATLNVNSQLTVAKTRQPRERGAGPAGHVHDHHQQLLDHRRSAASRSPTRCRSSAATRWSSRTRTGSRSPPAAPGGTFVNAPGSSVFSWTGGTIVGGVGPSPGVCILTIRANAPLTATVGTTFTNTIPIGGITGDGGVGNTNSSSGRRAS